MDQSKVLLKKAVEEIRILRNRNEIQSARLDMFDSMMSVLHTDVARRSQGMSIDIVYEIEKHIEAESD